MNSIPFSDTHSLPTPSTDAVNRRKSIASPASAAAMGILSSRAGLRALALATLLGLVSVQATSSTSSSTALDVSPNNKDDELQKLGPGKCSPRPKVFLWFWFSFGVLYHVEYHWVLDLVDVCHFCGVWTQEETEDCVFFLRYQYHGQQVTPLRNVYVCIYEIVTTTYKKERYENIIYFAIFSPYWLKKGSPNARKRVKGVGGMKSRFSVLNLKVCCVFPFDVSG